MKTPESFPQLQYTQEHKAVSLGNPALGLHARERIEACAQAVRKRFAQPVEAAIILGTGLGALADEIEVEATISYQRPARTFRCRRWSRTAGGCSAARSRARTVVAMQGRFHRYEGYTLQQVTFPVRVLRALGADTLVVTNACGGMHPLWAPGDLMLIADHLNLLGDNPLDRAERRRARPALSGHVGAVRSRAPRARARESRCAHGITLREGVYAAVPGPISRRAPSTACCASLGADVVGMSTVPEVIVARHGGMRVLGLSIITDQCLPDALEPATRRSRSSPSRARPSRSSRPSCAACWSACRMSDASHRQP